MITPDQWLVEKFIGLFPSDGFPWGILILSALAIIISVVLCGMVGLEREKRGRSAGLRTHLLVGVGSCIVMIISIYGFPKIFTSTDGVATRDVARLAAGVIAGVGFLGAGAIIHNNGSIKGLTTAGTIWLVMAIGLACGSFNFILAIGGTLVVMIVLIWFRGLERRVTRNNPVIVVLSKSNVPIMSILLKLANEYDAFISDVSTTIIQQGNDDIVETSFKLNHNHKGTINFEEFNDKLSKEPDVLSIQILNHH